MMRDGTSRTRRANKLRMASFFKSERNDEMPREPKLPAKTQRGTRRKTKEERSESLRDVKSRIDSDEAIYVSTRLRESHRGYGDRLADGFGMMGGD